MSDDALRTIRALAANADGDALYRLATAHIQSGELALAEEAFRCAYAAGHVEALGRLARVVDALDRPDEAEQLYRAAMDDGDELAMLDLADMILLDPGRQGEAETLLRRAVDAEVPTAPYVLGKLLARQPGREAEAEAALGAESLPAVVPHARFELARVLHRVPGREADVEQALRDSGTAMALASLAQLVRGRPGGEDEAVLLLRRAAELGHSASWNNLTVELKELGRDTEAAAAYRDAIRAGEEGLIVHYGEFLYERGDEEAAEAVLRAGLDVDPRCRYVLGAILARRSDRHAEGRALLIQAASAGVVAAALALGR